MSYDKGEIIAMAAADGLGELSEIEIEHILAEQDYALYAHDLYVPIEVIARRRQAWERAFDTSDPERLLDIAYFVTQQVLGLEL